MLRLRDLRRPHQPDTSEAGAQNSAVRAVRGRRQLQQAEMGENVMDISMKCELVQAKDLDPGEPFKKRTGSYVHIKLSESSVKWMGLDPNFIWGVTHNGNVSKLKPNKLVAPSSLIAMIKNTMDTVRWNLTFSGKHWLV